MKRAAECIAGVEDLRPPAAMGGLQQKFARAPPMRIRLIDLGKVEKQVASICEGLQSAAIAKMEG